MVGLNSRSSRRGREREEADLSRSHRLFDLPGVTRQAGYVFAQILCLALPREGEHALELNIIISGVCARARSRLYHDETRRRLSASVEYAIPIDSRAERKPIARPLSEPRLLREGLIRRE